MYGNDIENFMCIYLKQIRYSLRQLNTSLFPFPEFVLFSVFFHCRTLPFSPFFSWCVVQSILFSGLLLSPACIFLHTKTEKSWIYLLFLLIENIQLTSIILGPNDIRFISYLSFTGHILYLRNIISILSKFRETWTQTHFELHEESGHLDNIYGNYGH